MYDACTLWVLGSHRGQIRALDVLEMELQMAVNCHVGAGNQTWCKSSRCSSSVRHGSVFPSCPHSLGAWTWLLVSVSRKTFSGSLVNTRKGVIDLRVWIMMEHGELDLERETVRWENGGQQLKGTQLGCNQWGDTLWYYNSWLSEAWYGEALGWGVHLFL